MDTRPVIFTERRSNCDTGELPSARSSPSGIKRVQGVTRQLERVNTKDAPIDDGGGLVSPTRSRTLSQRRAAKIQAGEGVDLSGQQLTTLSVVDLDRDGDVDLVDRTNNNTRVLLQGSNTPGEDNSPPTLSSSFPPCPWP